MGQEEGANGSPTWGPTVIQSLREKWPLFQSQTTLSLSELPTVVHPGGACHRFRLGAASHPFCRNKLNRLEPMGLRKINQKSLPLR